MVITEVFKKSAAQSNKYSFYQVFTLMSLFLLLFGAVPVFSQNPQLGSPTLLQQTLNNLPAVPIPGVGSLNFQFGGNVWMAKLNGQNLLAGTIDVYETNEGSILILKQTHTYAKIAWIKTPGSDINLEYKKDPKSISVIPKSDLEAKLATIKTGAPGAVSAALSNALVYDDEKDFTVEVINDGNSARITRYNGKNTEINIPPRIGNHPVTEIGDRAFTKKGLTSVVIPDSVIFIGNFAFSDNPIGSVSLGANVYIANNAFESTGYNSFSAGFYNSQGRQAGTYSNSWRLVSAAAQTAQTAQVTNTQQPAVRTDIPPAGKSMVLINGGTMPLRDSITVSSFYMWKYEITQKEYKELMGIKNNPSRFLGNKKPVEQVTWYEAIEFCNKLSSKERLTPAYTISGEGVTWNRSANGYRLPTEAEWEYACRAGTRTEFNTGADITLKQANFYNRDLNRSVQGTKPVGSYKPNAWGLYDMHGNVDEWCWDWYDDNLPSGQQTDPIGPITGSRRVIRGGSYNSNDERDLFSDTRKSTVPNYRLSNIGFRVVRNAQLR